MSDLVSREEADRWARSTVAQTEGELRLAQSLVAVYKELDAARAELATSRVTIQVLRGEVCAEEKADGNGGCGVCPTCAQEATARAEDAELQLSAARAELAKAREEEREACAGIADEWTVDGLENQDIAAAIRARGK